jgi:hypothetical protein
MAMEQEQFNKSEINADTTFKIQRQVLTDEIDDPEILEFAIENLDELFSFIINGILKINIQSYPIEAGILSVADIVYACLSLIYGKNVWI